MKLRWRWNSERGLWEVKLCGIDGILPFVVYDGHGMQFLADVLAQKVDDYFCETELVQ